MKLRSRTLFRFAQLALTGAWLAFSAACGSAPTFTDSFDTAGIDDADSGDGATDSPNDAIDAASDTSADANGDTAKPDAKPFDAPPKSCTAMSSTCGPTEFCDAPSCGSGTCKPRPASPSKDFAPACGCNGVTYWNAAEGEARGETISYTGPCSGSGTKGCGGFSTSKCAASDTCVIDLSAYKGCAVADVGGQCWFIPVGAKCPGVGFTDYRDCASAKCSTYCQAVKNGGRFRKDSTCPM